MEATLEQFIRQELGKLDERTSKLDERQSRLEQDVHSLKEGQGRLEQDVRSLKDGHVKIIQWVIGIFIGMSVIMISAGSLYINILLNAPK